MQHNLAQITHRIWNVAVYVRISESERDKSESDSIFNQKRYIQKYIEKDSSLNIARIYSDDGVGGGSFNRPAFNNMIADIEKGEIDCVIVKDLSRFGREHIQADNYLEIYFPSKQIRFISISEHIDSFKNPERMDSIDIPFTNLLNGHYLTQVSISTKSSLQIKQKEGKYVSAITPYGYLKSPYDKHKLIIDTEVKDIIKTIYNRYIGGVSLRDIARGLNDNNISTPAKYRAIKKGKSSNSKWKSAIVRKILNQPIYTGDMVQARTYSPNHKVKKRMQQSEDKWIIVPNTHEAIIDKNIYDLAQEILTRDIKPVRRKQEEDKPSVLAGYVYCSDCGMKMVRSSANYKDKRISRFICSTYKQKGSKVCSSHFIKEDDLIDILYTTINLHATNFADHEYVIKKVEEHDRKNNVSSFIKNRLKKAEKELSDLKMIRQGLYKDYKLNIISSIEYAEMKAGFESQYNNLLKEIDNINKQSELDKNKEIPINETLEYFKEFRKFKTLDRNMIVHLVDRVIVGVNKEVEIVFRFRDVFENKL